MTGDEFQAVADFEAGLRVGDAVFLGASNAEALGHALFFLSCADDLERGVRLDITQDE